MKDKNVDDDDDDVDREASEKMWMLTEWMKSGRWWVKSR